MSRNRNANGIVELNQQRQISINSFPSVRIQWLNTRRFSHLVSTVVVFLKSLVKVNDRLEVRFV